LCQGFLEWLCGNSCVRTLDLEMMMRNLFHLNERVHVAFMGALGLLGRGYLRIEYITLTDPTLNLCLVSKRNNVKLLSCSLWGFCC